MKKEASQLFTHEKYDYAIKINKKELFYKSLYNLFKTELNILRKYLDNILVKSWIKYFISSADTSVLFILKKDEDLRLYMNYQNLNHIIIKNWHSLSLINKILDQLSETKIFIKLDLKNAYHHIWIWHGNKWKTAFCTYYSHFKYMIMLFKLINALVIFQIYINQIFISIINLLCVIYLNDILIYSHEKCIFFINNVKFLRFIVSINSVMMNS